MEIITKDEVSKLLSGNLDDAHAVLNEALSRVLNKAVEDAMRYTPELTAKLIKTVSANTRMAEEFLNRNPAFKGHLDVVRAVVSKIEKQNPNLTYQEILEKAEPEIYRNINSMSQLKLEM